MLGNARNRRSVTPYGDCLFWASELRYLGVNIGKSTSLKFSFDRAKQHFYRAANSGTIFGKIGRFASEEVVIQLFKSKYKWILLIVLYWAQLKAVNV